MEQRVDRALRVELRERGDLGRRSAEAGAAQQMRGVPCVERSAVGREGGRGIELPGRAEADLRIGRRIEFCVHGGCNG